MLHLHLSSHAKQSLDPLCEQYGKVFLDIDTSPHIISIEPYYNIALYPFEPF